MKIKIAAEIACGNCGLAFDEQPDPRLVEFAGIIYL